MHAPPLARWKHAPAAAVVGRNLTKRFRNLEAVRSISFDVAAGDDSTLTNMR